MSNRIIRIIFILSVGCSVLMFAAQYVWIKKAYELEKNIFNTHVTIALKNVADQILRMNDNTSLMDSIISRQQDSYYTVQVNDNIDSTALEYLLKRELLAQQIKTDFEYSVYDCASEEMKYGKYVSYTNTEIKPDDNKLESFPRNPKLSGNNYFAVHFPHLDHYITQEMSNWIWSTLILVLFLVILAYAIFIIFRQKRLSEIQKDFVNNMTHEFKTPLATIKLSSEVLKNPNIVNNPERLLNYATIINNETLHLTNQVERVLQMAKSNKEGINLNIDHVSLKEMLDEIIEKKYKPLLRSRGGNIKVDMDSTETELYVDKLHFKNVISNLLDNAIKYCELQPVILISTKENSQGVQIAIKDNGIGIDKGDLKNIFKKFYRVPTGNVHKVKGFGLGLNYVKLICKLHGGDIKVTSDLGIGSEFTIFIPRNYKS
jgi:two-component system phosphate regulon sensor histidine kinase PhoR